MKDSAEILVSDAQPHVDILLQEFQVAGMLPTGWNDVAVNQEARRNIWPGQSPDGRKWDSNMPEGERARPWNGCSDTRIPLVDGVCNAEVAVNCAAFAKGELRATAVDFAQSDLEASASKYLHWWVHTRYPREWHREAELATQFSREHGWCAAYIGWERELGKRRQKVTIEELGEFLARLEPQAGASTAQGMGATSPQPSPPQAAERGPDPDAGSESSEMDSGGPTDEAESQGGAAAPPYQVQASGPGVSPAPNLVAMILDPSQAEVAAEGLREIYREYVTRLLEGKGYFAEELNSESVLELGAPAAKRCVKELREKGECWLPVTYVVKNQPLIQALMPYLEFLAARGTTELQRSRVLFWRRWLSEWELDAKKAEGWDPEWIEQVKKTKGNISSWAAAFGDGTQIGLGTKRVSGTLYVKVSEQTNPLIEVVHAYVKKVDDEGVTSVWETVFSPHITKLPGANDAESLDLGPMQFDATKPADRRVGDTFCAKHEPLDYAHGRYPFEEFKRENIGRALIDTRSVAEIATTWQGEVKNIRDALFNRSQWDTLPPVKTSLGALGYQLGPGAQVPMKRNDVIEALNLNGSPPQLGLELVELIMLQCDDYFGLSNAKLPPERIAAQRQKAVTDFYFFWGAVFLQAFALQLQYNPDEIARITGDEALAGLSPFEVFERLQFGIQFDVMELNPDYLQKKIETLLQQAVPSDTGGTIDHVALTRQIVRMVDPALARSMLMDKSAASQQTFREVDTQLQRMALGNEAEYTENDPTAATKMQFLASIMQSNPKYQKWMQEDPRFQALTQNYAKNLQMSMMQQQNKQVGRIGVKQVGAGQGQ